MVEYLSEVTNQDVVVLAVCAYDSSAVSSEQDFNGSTPDYIVRALCMDNIKDVDGAPLEDGYEWYISVPDGDICEVGERYLGCECNDVWNIEEWCKKLPNCSSVVYE